MQVKIEREKARNHQLKQGKTSLGKGHDSQSGCGFQKLKRQSLVFL